MKLSSFVPGLVAVAPVLAAPVANPTFGFGGVGLLKKFHGGVGVGHGVGLGHSPGWFKPGWGHGPEVSHPAKDYDHEDEEDHEVDAPEGEEHSEEDSPRSGLPVDRTIAMPISVDSAGTSMRGWLQARDYCEPDGSIGGKAQGYLQGVLNGQAGFEGLFGLSAGFSLNAGAGITFPGLSVGAGANAGFDGVFRAGIEGLLSGGISVGVGANVNLGIPQVQEACKGWLQGKGYCEDDGSIGAEAQAYINGVLGGTVGFEGLLGIQAGFALGAGVNVGVGAGVGAGIGGIAVATLEGALNGLLTAGGSVGLELGAQGNLGVGVGAGASFNAGVGFNGGVGGGVGGGFNAGAGANAGINAGANGAANTNLGPRDVQGASIGKEIAGDVLQDVGDNLVEANHFPGHRGWGNNHWAPRPAWGPPAPPAWNNDPWRNDWNDNRCRNEWECEQVWERNNGWRKAKRDARRVVADAGEQNFGQAKKLGDADAIRVNKVADLDLDLDLEKVVDLEKVANVRIGT